MGNTKSTRLKDLYTRGRVDVIQSENEKLVGSFKVLTVESFRDEIFILKVLDPRIYDQYADIPEFIKKLSQQSPNICDFYFINNNLQNKDLYDLLFEYGPVIDTSIQTERELWNFIVQIVDALCFLEENLLHYPVVAKKYVIKFSKDKIKLLNPYCFPDFIKEVIQIYLNPMNPMSSRRKYNKLQITRNIKEFGIMIITLLSSANEYQLKTDIAYVAKIIDQLAVKYSKGLIMLLKYILMSQNPPKSLQELRNHMTNYRQSVAEVSKGGLNKKPTLTETSPTPAPQGQFEIKASELEKIANISMNTSVDSELRTPVSPNSRGLRIFTDERPSDSLKHRSLTPPNARRIFGQSIGEAAKDNRYDKSPEPEKKYSPTIDDIENKRDATPTKEQKKGGFLENLINLASFGRKNQSEELKSTSSLPIKPQFDDRQAKDHDSAGLNTREINSLPNPDRHVSKDEFFKESNDILKEKRSSLNSVPLINDFQKFDFEFLNTSSRNNQNINLYLQTHDPNIQEKFLQAHNVAHENLQNHPFFEESNVYFKKKSGEVAVRGEAEDVRPSQPPADQQKPDKSKVENPSTQANKQPNRVVKRMILKWNLNQNKHVRFIEYDDGTIEEAKEDSAETVVDIKNTNFTPSISRSVEGQPRNKSPIPNDKPSYPLNYDYPRNGPSIVSNGFEAKTNNSINFILVPVDDQPPLLIFRSRPTPPNHRFNELAAVVDKHSPYLPSVYHQVDDEPRNISYHHSRSGNDLDRHSTPTKVPNGQLVRPPSTGNLSLTDKPLKTATSLSRSPQIIRRN